MLNVIFILMLIERVHLINSSYIFCIVAFIFSFFKKNLLLINYFCSWITVIVFMLIVVYSLVYSSKENVIINNLYFALVFSSINIFFHIYFSKFFILNEFCWAMPNMFDVKHTLNANINLIYIIFHLFFIIFAYFNEYELCTYGFKLLLLFFIFMNMIYMNGLMCYLVLALSLLYTCFGFTNVYYSYLVTIIVLGLIVFIIFKHDMNLSICVYLLSICLFLLFLYDNTINQESVIKSIFRIKSLDEYNEIEI